MTELLAWLLKAVAGKLVAEESAVWLRGLCGCIVRISTGLLCESERARYAEEWAAALADQETSLQRLRFALGTVRSALVQRHHARHPDVSFFTPSLIRCCDIILAVVLMITAAPLLLIVTCALLISSHGKGPVVTRKVIRDGQVWNSERLRFNLENLPNASLRRHLKAMGIQDLTVMFSLLRGDISFVGRHSIITPDGATLKANELAFLLKIRPGIIPIQRYSLFEPLPPITLRLYFQGLRRFFVESTYVALGRNKCGSGSYTRRLP